MELPAGVCKRCINGTAEGSALHKSPRALASLPGASRSGSHEGEGAAGRGPHRMLQAWGSASPGLTPAEAHTLSVPHTARGHGITQLRFDAAENTMSRQAQPLGHSREEGTWVLPAGWSHSSFSPATRRQATVGTRCRLSHRLLLPQDENKKRLACGVHGTSSADPETSRGEYQTLSG